MDKWQRYEAMKKEWVKAHLDASNEEYQAAMRSIAEKCGV